jgi:hypothetical protein
MMAIQGTLWVFEGRSNELFFTYDLRALEQQKFFKAGKLTAWSVAHGGPGPRSISRSVYLLMCHQSAPLSDLDIGVLLDEDKGGKLQQVTSMKFCHVCFNDKVKTTITLEDVLFCFSLKKKVDICIIAQHTNRAN